MGLTAEMLSQTNLQLVHFLLDHQQEIVLQQVKCNSVILSWPSLQMPP